MCTWDKVQKCHGRSNIQQKFFSPTRKLDLNWRKKAVKRYIWSLALCDAETCTLRKLDQKYLETFEMWCWRRMGIRWTDRVGDEKVQNRVKEERNILRTVKWRKATWIGQILCRKCLLQHVTEVMIRGTGRRWRRLKQLLDDLKENRRYWNLK
jgi:hypothetical protein